MNSSRTLRRLLLGYLILHLIAAGIFVLVLTSMVRNQMVRDSRARLDALASMMVEHVEQSEDKLAAPDLADYVQHIGSETQTRFTLITSEGDVVADSTTGTRDIGPHGTREEVLAAKQSGVGFSQRHSDTLNQPMMYLAKKFGDVDSSDGGYVRVAVEANSIESAVGSVQRYVWTFAVALGALTAMLMAWLSSSYLKPLETFSQAARKIGKGDFESVSTAQFRDDEWGELGTAFDQMRSELNVRENRMEENSQRLEAVLSSMIEGVLAVKPNGEVMLANGAACRMLSFHREKLVGRKLSEVVRIPEFTQAIEKSQRERTFSKTEFKTITDPIRTLKVRVSMLADEDKPGLAVVLHDVSELRQLETMRQDFVANVSHELKTPLASIKAYAETLRMGAIHDENKNIQFLEQIEFQADTLNHQIQDLLQLARVESGEKTFSISDVDVNMICESLHRQFLDAALGRHLELRLQLAHPIPLARCDVEAIDTVVKNLVVNAIHYTPEGGRVSRFYRVDKARSRDMGGTGLGLAIVKHLTQAFGGTVTLESQLGKGTQFHVRLPKSKS